MEPETLDCSSLTSSVVARSIVHAEERTSVVCLRNFTATPTLALQKADSGTSPWPALVKWRDIHYLSSLVDPEAKLDAMTSDSHLFIGDSENYKPSLCSFSEIVDVSSDDRRHLYLAQSTIVSKDSPLQTALTPLTVDFGVPGPLMLARQCTLGSILTETPSPQGPDLSLPAALHLANLEHVNLWLSVRGSRSDLHCDEYQNILCMVRGKKIVHLVHPSHTQALLPQPLIGDSPNHSRLALDDLDPALVHSVSLEPGDALFLPEGWWHCVDSVASPSDPFVLGINFWWRSRVEAAVQGGQALLMARRALRFLCEEQLEARLLGHRQQLMLSEDRDLAEASLVESLGLALKACASNSAPLVSLLVSAPPTLLRRALGRLAEVDPALIEDLFVTVIPAHPLVGVAVVAHFENAAANAAGDSTDFFAKFYAACPALSDEELLAVLLRAKELETKRSLSEMLSRIAL